MGGNGPGFYAKVSAGPHKRALTPILGGVARRSRVLLDCLCRLSDAFDLLIFQVLYHDKWDLARQHVCISNNGA